MTKKQAESLHPSLKALAAVHVTDEVVADLVNKRHFGRLGFEILKETGVLTSIISSVQRGGEKTDVLPRNRALCAGLLLRMAKFMQAVAKLSTEQGHGPVIAALFRCIVESAVNVMYLIKHDDDELYDSFIKTGLSVERALYDQINENVSKRNGVLMPIESRILKSIEMTCEKSRIEIEELVPKHKNWSTGGGFRERLADVWHDNAYVGLFRVASHAVHGTWGDLILNYLSPRGDGYVLNDDFKSADARTTLPMCMIAVEACHDYLTAFIGSPEEVPGFHEGLIQFRDKLFRIDEEHEKWIQSRQIADLASE